MGFQRPKRGESLGKAWGMRIESMRKAWRRLGEGLGRAFGWRMANDKWQIAKTGPGVMRTDGKGLRAMGEIKGRRIPDLRFQRVGREERGGQASFEP